MMRKNWFKMLLALTVSLAPLYEVSATTISEDDLIPQLEQSTTTETTVTEVSSGTEKLSDYFTAETPALLNAGQTKLAASQFRLQYQINKLEWAVNKMADDGVVTSDELHDLKANIKSYYQLRSSVNKKLAFYRLDIPEDERVEIYRKLADIQDGQFSVDDKNESVKRFFVNLTGKDVKVKMGVSDKLGVSLIGTIGIAILAILL